ncbi:MAG: bifunctional 5,10-methylenetetrahydrofolate dehydrogenase/5,10-methenyltetrahydrofolate cyclohydrolase [Minisyncoccia bacterium]
MLAQGKIIAEKLNEELNKKLLGKNKSVCFVVFGEDPATEQFVNMKLRLAQKTGIDANVSKYNTDSSFSEMKKIIEDEVLKKPDGIVVQLPLPKSVNAQDVLNLVPVSMDIDVLSEDAKEQFVKGLSEKTPPVARAVFEILNFYNVSMFEKKVLVIGSGRLVGEPVALMLKNRKIPFDQVDIASPTETKNSLMKDADIIITGAGDPLFIKPEMIKDGVVLIDAGTSESEGRIVGDVDPSCFEKASLVTPVPGGVGPVTLSSLFLNLFDLDTVNHFSINSKHEMRNPKK